MELVIIHHHLNRGGVAQVIANHLRSLSTLPAEKQPSRVVLIYDGQKEGWPEQLLLEPNSFPVDLVELPEIGYDSFQNNDSQQATPAELTAKLLETFKSQNLTAANTLLHCHNHSLGKNASLPGALQELAQAGWKLLLQIHDFAEDNRPANYKHLMRALGGNPVQGISHELYPQSSSIHYATLTSRDANLLRSAGLATDRLHVLPNPASEFTDFPEQQAARDRVLPLLNLAPTTQLIVYPVRGIRRKNLGEMLLLSALAPPGFCFAITLAPKNPIEKVTFDRWIKLAKQLELLCVFDTGGTLDVPFHDLLAASNQILTTSVAEGFGMVFLEAWLAGKPLIGRNLPDITKDFVNAGLEFPGLYDKLMIPFAKDLMQRASIIDKLKESYREVCKAYQVKMLDNAHLEEQLRLLFEDNAIDFGRLPVVDQLAIILHAAREPEFKQSIFEANPLLSKILTTSAKKDNQRQIESNAETVQSVYSEEKLGEQLQQIFATLSQSESSTTMESLPDGPSILNHFVTPHTILPVRTDS